MARTIIAVAFIALLAIPMAVQPERRAEPQDSLRLIVITPHNEQIRSEFSQAFSRWVADNFNDWPAPQQRALLEEAGLLNATDDDAAFQRFMNEHEQVSARVIYNVPGGTSEIRKMLFAQYAASAHTGTAPGGDADLVFGGGSYEHGRLKDGVTGPAGQLSISEPVVFDPAWLQSIYGENLIGDVPLHDPQGYWYGAALSGFGIVYNRDVLAELRLDEPTLWRDLCDPRLRGWVALVNPAQSGSVTTAFETILKQRGWVEGWRILRRAGANGRYFSASSLAPPSDVSAGNAAMGVCIDFYGRFQSQAILAATGEDRVGYVDPPGVSTIDPDPISRLRGAPHPLLAQKFIGFALSGGGLALSQSRAHETAAADSERRGPRQFELRRMPIRRDMYVNHFDRFIDQVNPFELARPVRYPDDNFRSFIAIVFAAAIMDVHDDLKRAWEAIVTHHAYPHDAGPIITSADVTDATLKEMLRLFDALPDVPAPGGKTHALEDPDQLTDIKSGWLRGGFADANLWPINASPADVLRRSLADTFRRNYQTIISMSAEE